MVPSNDSGICALTLITQNGIATHGSSCERMKKKSSVTGDQDFSQAELDTSEFISRSPYLFMIDESLVIERAWEIKRYYETKNNIPSSYIHPLSDPSSGHQLSIYRDSDCDSDSQPPLINSLFGLCKIEDLHAGTPLGDPNTSTKTKASVNISHEIKRENSDHIYISKEERSVDHTSPVLSEGLSRTTKCDGSQARVRRCNFNKAPGRSVYPNAEYLYFDHHKIALALDSANSPVARPNPHDDPPPEVHRPPLLVTPNATQPTGLLKSWLGLARCSASYTGRHSSTSDPNDSGELQDQGPSDLSDDTTNNLNAKDAPEQQEFTNPQNYLTNNFESEWDSWTVRDLKALGILVIIFQPWEAALAAQLFSLPSTQPPPPIPLPSSNEQYILAHPTGQTHATETQIDYRALHQDSILEHDASTAPETFNPCEVAAPPLISALDLQLCAAGSVLLSSGATHNLAANAQTADDPISAHRALATEVTNASIVAHPLPIDTTWIGI
ncbi:hypothetical protein CTheo_4857 [Ceratobasidium theobromae]|uniref:Uncharacterized protein n=1 Tax=Ceratobasidium theobromae TaxID=1582974 RepID=A0A5N5QJI3_9AGAM|nr:hypothetical protein CTheo_4857 [Ceratobasidium theobromae]